MANAVTRWAALFGTWSLRGDTATYRGGDEQNPLGLAVSNLLFREGQLAARVKIADPSHQARIVFGLDPERVNYYSIGIGGLFGYYLDRFERNKGPTALQSWGPPSSLGAGVHQLELTLRGQSLEFTVDAVPIFGAQLPQPLTGEQIGALAVGAGVRFDDVEAVRLLPRAFVVMAFESPFDDLYAEVVRPVCDEVGLEPVRADELRYPGVILHDIIAGLIGSTVVIAEITPANPNVFYELGYAHGIGQPTILLARKGTELPFDVSGYRVIFYDDSIGGKPAVERELRFHLQNILGVPVVPA